MTELKAWIHGELVETEADAVRLELDDERHGTGRLVARGSVMAVILEGSGSDWVVTLRGRRIPVTVRSWREEVLAAAETAASTHSGPIEVKATLPGMVVAVSATVGDDVSDGDSLVTIEAMKMQNEVRAPRAGRVIEVSVVPGQTVATGAALLRLE